MLADFGWKMESDGNWLKIKYGVPSSNVKINEHLYFDYVSHETLMIMLRFLYRKLNSGLQLQLSYLSNARTYIFQTQYKLVKLQLGLLTGTINSGLGFDCLMTKNEEIQSSTHVIKVLWRF
jgi:hypothetical protein